MSNEKIKKETFEDLKVKIEEKKGNVDSEFIDSISKASQDMDESEEMRLAKAYAEAEAYGMSPEEMEAHKASVGEFIQETEEEEEAEAEQNPGEVDPKGLLDNILGRFSSRKLLVWGIATAALFYAKIPADQWVNISVAYISGQSVVDVFKILKGVK
ncbi:MAG: hypothetical protein KAX20_07980 [Candidatus Omnitrophica bacterium]|nr:hypothetical protein [Candidatus Omnitrophota bacterium]